MPLLDFTGFETGLLSSTLTSDEFDAVSVGASATLTRSSSPARGGQSALQAATGASSVVSYGERDWGSDQATVFYELYVRWNTVPSAITYAFSIYDSTPAVILDLGVNASGNWIVKNAGDATIYTSTGSAVIAGYWYRVELKLVSSATVGTIDVKIENVLEPGLSGLTSKNTKPGGNQRRWRAGVTVAQASAPTRFIDDVLVTTTGFVGAGYTAALQLGGADLDNWTESGGVGVLGWQALIEYPWTTGGGNFIKSSVANQEARYTLRALAQSTTGLTILGVQPILQHARNVAGSAAAAVVNIRSNGSDGTTKSLDAGGVTLTTLRGFLEVTDPHTGSAWALSAVNALMLRILHDAGTNQANVYAAIVMVAYSLSAEAGSLDSDLDGPASGKRVPRAFIGSFGSPDPAVYRNRGRKKLVGYG